jgi:hypothetical protein
MKDFSEYDNNMTSVSPIHCGSHADHAVSSRENHLKALWPLPSDPGTNSMYCGASTHTCVHGHRQLSHGPSHAQCRGVLDTVRMPWNQLDQITPSKDIAELDGTVL